MSVPLLAAPLPAPGKVSRVPLRTAAAAAGVQSRNSRQRPGWSGRGRAGAERGGEREGWGEFGERMGEGRGGSEEAWEGRGRGRRK